MSFFSQHHSFDIALATEYGVEKAILIHHFQHWIRINRRGERNLHDGRCWMYQARKDIQAHFPYWSYEQIKHMCEQLVEEGVLITGNYNKLALDRTLWYAFVDEKKFGVDQENSNNLYEKGKFPNGQGNLPNALGKSPSAIPDTKPYTKSSDAKTTTIKSVPTHARGCSGEKKIEEKPLPESVSGSHLEYTKPNGVKESKSISDVYRILMPLNYANSEIVDAIKIARTTQYIGDIIRFLQATIEKRRQTVIPMQKAPTARYIPGNNNELTFKGETKCKIYEPEKITR